MPVKHVVVVMFENRSYDNVLGWLYNAGNQAPYQEPPAGQRELDGLNGDESNPDPNHAGKLIPVANQTAPTQAGQQGPAYAPTAIPIIDPGELFKDMAQQITGSAKPPTSNPYPDYPEAYTATLTQGYTLNYAQLTDLLGLKPKVPESNVGDVMNYLTPAQMPVTAFLANNYAVCDRWFASTPTQTYPNRAFALCAAPGITHDGKFSLIEDAQYYLHELKHIPSLLSQLDTVLGEKDGVPAWKVYFHDYCIAAKTVPQVADAVKDKHRKNVNVATFDDADWGSHAPRQLKSVTSTFVADLAQGKLPPFAFVEPRYFDNYARGHLPPNSNHPGQGNFPGDPLVAASTRAPIDAASGEVFLMQLYNLLRAGPAWDDTLLIVTYDEHGGIYDHKPPPKAMPPGAEVPRASNLTDRAADGFGYDVLGGRVPALVVSPLIAKGSTIRSTPSAAKAGAFDHTSIISTTWDAFNLAKDGCASLNQRDLHAPSIVPHLEASAENTTPAFSGTIVAGPGALAFSHHCYWPGQPAPQTIIAGAGPDTILAVSVSLPAGRTWLSASLSADISPQVSVITVNIDVSGLPEATYAGTIVITGGGNSPVSIPVTLTIASPLP